MLSTTTEREGENSLSFENNPLLILYYFKVKKRIRKKNIEIRKIIYLINS